MTTIGFAGAGVMGQPMAMKLAAATAADLIVWNRTSERLEPVLRLGARRANSLDQLFGESDIIILMLADDASTDIVLGLGSRELKSRVNGKTIVNMGTGAADHSVALERTIGQHGGIYIEAPVSGSRGPAETGQLIAMVAGGGADHRRQIRDVIAPMCRESFDAGAIPSALNLKLAVNLYLITMVTGLAEAINLGQYLGVDLTTMRRVMDAGPMASDVSRAKSAKMVASDFDPQASIGDVLKNCHLVANAAQACGANAPLLNESLRLFEERVRSGDQALDMAAVIRSVGGAAPGKEGSVQWRDIPAI